MSTTAALSQALASRRVLVSDDTLDKRIVQEGNRLKVEGPGDVEVACVLLAHQDLATAYYDAMDGIPRAWAPAYLPRGINDQDSRKTMSVYAAGGTPAEAIKGFLDSVNDLPKEDRPLFYDYLEDQGRWSAQVSGEACGYAVEGCLVPGGVILTQWS